ncbi:stage II sporulation protein P [Eubacterium sp. An11]|uniref:stage II sporulation protein P n=1 Tax=Eubacterium sp. An11 TaxID=1965542 RepID=UPI0013A5F3EA|nr:stage II sporulation protein P [Eubacterium sp. An11]
MEQSFGRVGRMVEMILIVVFVILWMAMVSDSKPGRSGLWEELKERIPLRAEIIKDAGINGIRNARNELVPILSYENYLEEDSLFLPLFRYALQTEMFPLQQYSVDYWEGVDNFSSLYSDAVPDYFTESDDESVEKKKKDAGTMETTGEGASYTIKELSDYDFLLSHFYIVDSTTTMTREDLNGKKLVTEDLSVDLDGDSGKEPLVLIYHTHGSETYKEEKGKSGSVLDVGKALKKELASYGIASIHDTSIYDQVNGELDRNAAYDYAGDSVEATLKKNPSIQVVLDLHRDSVEDSIHLVTEVDGKDTAQIMFFNGVSRLKSGELTYLKNPNKSANLAFSLQMQLLAAKYYPDFTRKIYIKGYRYNLHLARRAVLIEVGAQNNTVSEAKNAMKPLAEMLYRLLSGEKAYRQ